MESKRATILLLLDNWRDRTLLTECVGQRYDVCAAEGDGGPLPDGCDLCVVDGPTLARMKARIAEWKQLEETIYLPVLLLTTRQEVTLITASLWHVIDDVITTPILKAEFHARVEVLLRCRRFSEEVLRQREVQASRERLHSAVERDRLMSAIEQAGEVIFITDRDGSIHYVNPAFEKLTGYTRAEALGCNPRILKSGEHPADFYAEMWRTLLDGCQWHGRLVNKAKDGAIFVEEATISPVYDFEGEIVNFVAVKRDITDYLRIQTEKEKLQEQFNQAQKMESIGRLAGGVAHDLNNMLVPIFGYSDLLLRHLDSGEKPAAYVHNIMDACNRARDIVKQLLAFSRKQPLEFRKVNLNDVVANFIKLLRRTIREDITIELKPAATPLVIEADVGQIEQVILNLLVNAQDSMPRGGRLIIESWRAELDEMEAAIHQDVTPGLYCVLALSDTGCGMDQETQRRIFEPFFTTKEAGKGTGLGLASVYGIVRQHSGSIFVYSEPRRGTTFKVYLPCAGETAVEAAESGSTEIVGGTEVILLVEDDEIVRSLTETVLGSLGYTVLVAEDGKKALKLLEEHGREVQLLLTDVVMPHMSANDLHCFVQSRFPGTRILYMSGYTSDVVAETGLLEKGIDFIQKPFSVKALANKVREVIDDTARSRLGWSCDDGGGERGESRPE